MGNTRRGITMIDVVIILVMVVFMTITLVAVTANTRESANIPKCAAGCHGFGTP